MDDDDDDDVVQINVGCSSLVTSEAVRLEYSVDRGSSWRPVVTACTLVDRSSPSCTDLDLKPSVFYPGVFSHWHRVVTPLADLHVCGYNIMPQR